MRFFKSLNQLLNAIKQEISFFKLLFSVHQKPSPTYSLIKSLSYKLLIFRVFYRLKLLAVCQKDTQETSHHHPPHQLNPSFHHLHHHHLLHHNHLTMNLWVGFNENRSPRPEVQYHRQAPCWVLRRPVYISGFKVLVIN